jgi:RNA polymerase sigma-70 factor (ECF subfamily)
VTSQSAADAVALPLRWAVGPATTECATPTLEDTYRQLAPAVLGYFRSHGMLHPEDLVGEVFVSVARSLRRFHGDADDLRRWVFAIARRRRVDHLRWLRVRRHVVTGDPPERAASDASSVLDIDLIAALQQLTALQRDVVVLRFVADLSIEDVARMLHRTRGAVKAAQLRALNQLADRLRPS